MTIAGDLLPKVASYQVNTAHNRRHSQAESGGMLFSYRTDSVVQPSTFTVTWTDRNPTLVEAIWQHYQEHAAGVFKWIGPGKSIQQTWRWLSAPSIQWTSARNASVTADVELALAFIP